MAVIVDPIDDDAVKFYKKYGFFFYLIVVKCLLQWKQFRDYFKTTL